MKVLLALSLLLFLDFVFSQADIIPCPTFASCPTGYSVRFAGPSMRQAECYCKKTPKELSPCELSVSSCEFYVDRFCAGLEKNCSPKEIMDACNKGIVRFPKVCDRLSQKLRKEKYAKSQETCEFHKNKCNSGLSANCIYATTSCDPDTTIQLCKDGKIPLNSRCEIAEIQKEKERAEDTKYSCDFAKKRCLEDTLSTNCPDIAEFCDVETAVKLCYNDDIKQTGRLSDEDCSRVIKKSQYLLFGKSKLECWEQLPLCEGGDSEACMQVPTLCEKEIVSALCNANKITSKRVCTYAGLEETTNSSYPGCNFFADKCNNREDRYCFLASDYCDDKTINGLCRTFRITDEPVCKRVQVDNSDNSPPVSDFPMITVDTRAK